MCARGRVCVCESLTPNRRESDPQSQQASLCDLIANTSVNWRSNYFDRKSIFFLKNTDTFNWIWCSRLAIATQLKNDKNPILSFDATLGAKEELYIRPAQIIHPNIDITPTRYSAPGK